MNVTTLYGETSLPDLYAYIADGFTLMCISHHDQRMVKKKKMDVEKGVNACKYKSPACTIYKLLLQDLLPPQLSHYIRDKKR